MAGAQEFFEEQSAQSQIKAAIVADYFWAWAGVIIGQLKKHSGQSQKIAYVDLFAGPGRYANGAKSTPLLILERAVKDPKYLPGSAHSSMTRTLKTRTPSKKRSARFRATRIWRTSRESIPVRLATKL